MFPFENGNNFSIVWFRDFFFFFLFIQLLMACDAQPKKEDDSFRYKRISVELVQLCSCEVMKPRPKKFQRLV